MNLIMKKCRGVAKTLVVCSLLASASVQAGGPVGGHVNHLSKNLPTYEKEVNWLIGKIDGIVERYQTSGTKAAHSDAVVEHWEAVKFHSAIESNYVLIYASIWQGLFGVKEAIDKGLPVDAVNAEQEKLEQALWQALGAVKMAAVYQDKGLLAKVKTSDDASLSTKDRLENIKNNLNRVVAKYAEKLNDVSTGLVAEVYEKQFEPIEDELKAVDEELTESIEKGFHVHIPNAIKQNKSVAEIRALIKETTDKVDKLLAKLKKS